MEKLITLLIISFLLIGCSLELSFTEVHERGINKDIQSFIDNTNEENGVHLYFEKEKEIYVYTIDWCSFGLGIFDGFFWVIDRFLFYRPS